MLRSGGDGLILVVEGSDDRHAIERHVHDSVTVLSGQGGKQELLEAAVLVDERGVSRVRILVDRDYDDSVPVSPQHANCIIASTHHDLVMDLILVDRGVMYRVINAHMRGAQASVKTRADDLLEEALAVAARVSVLRMLSVSNDWDLNMARFPFGKFDQVRPNPLNVVDVALARSRPGPKKSPVLRQLRAALKVEKDATISLVGDHDLFGALAHVLRKNGHSSASESALAASFFAAVDCPSIMKTDWYAEISGWSSEAAGTPSFVCPCDSAA